ncbi:restriction endonuclease subunit S [Pseudomonas aeruginosa]|uniref:restriction endonuclease subunit S n=1 Tax=Pseudomonas aeruginosa TaxID=287 RepID=UPI0010676DCF|nr:restriction endonuclease subunit S [Pseudomonas aeruginosa]ECF1840981.1 restriction endonuclease subunit S [Salmonella enterica subsp. enterica serovar Tennessee]TEI21612.1 restriction endonuclease subunit S [Pseudomonas aeruginosa]TEI23783.1 restriction endonuclease subunit S [Pseudomonas aeruginosa]
MSGNEKQPLVLRLRFPEFREAEEWKLEPLGKLAKRRTVKNVGLEHTRVLTNSAEFGVLDQRDYFEKDIANQGNLEGYYIVEKGDYVYNPRISASAPVGPISKNNVGTGVMSPLYTVFRFDSSDNDFFAHYFKSTHWHQYMRQASSTGARHDRMSITNDDFMGLPLPISKPEEQQKIADCLSSLDDLIAAETQKLDTLKTHKKGLMQKLFPREGETVPRLRFPEFSNAEDWKEWKVGELGNVITGNTPSTSKPQYYEGEYNFVSPADISDQRFIESTKTTLSKLGFEQTRQIPAGSVLFVCIGSTIGKVAQNMYSCATNQQINSLVPSSNFSGDFIYYLLLHESNRIAELAGNQAVPIVNKSTFSDVSVLCPREKEEQERVAGYLGTLDDLIYAQTQKIDTLKTHKKGLMQQLFPTLDEVPA